MSLLVSSMLNEYLVKLIIPVMGLENVQLHMLIGHAYFFDMNENLKPF